MVCHGPRSGQRHRGEVSRHTVLTSESGPLADTSTLSSTGKVGNLGQWAGLILSPGPKPQASGSCFLMHVPMAWGTQVVVVGGRVLPG